MIFMHSYKYINNVLTNNHMQRLSTLVWEIILISEYINIVYKSFKRYLQKHNYMTVKQIEFFHTNANNPIM